MIDLETLARCQKTGLDKIMTLTDDEKTKIDTICAYACSQIIEAVIQQKQPLQKAVNDGFLFGIALGTTLKIEKGELVQRNA